MQVPQIGHVCTQKMDAQRNSERMRNVCIGLVFGWRAGRPPKSKGERRVLRLRVVCGLRLRNVSEAVYQAALDSLLYDLVTVAGRWPVYQRLRQRRRHQSSGRIHINR
jgi:hypothetical protein